MNRIPFCFTCLLTLLCLAQPVCGEMLDASDAAGKVKQAAPPKAKPFPPDEVRLLPGLFKTGQDTAAVYLLSLEPDRFLANFRKEAGLPTKAQQYGGWESQGVSGHSAGHYLSACALAYAATGDPSFLQRVNYMVAELKQCQEANENGYVAAIPGGKQIFADISKGKISSSGFDLNGGWVPFYTLHKLFGGLRDAYRLCGNKDALEIARKLGDWVEATVGGLKPEQMQLILACEHGGMNETLADLYADSGDERYLKLSRQFHHRAILDPLAQGQDILPGKHANTQIPKLIGLATRYELAGDPSDRAAANFFWERVVDHHSYVTGGHCDHEHFGEPDRLNDRLSDDTTETCNVYNMLKLTQHVFGWNPSANVADFYERALLNHIRSTQHPDGRVIYNLTLKPGGTKHYQSKYEDFTCCVDSGMENHVKYDQGIYFQDDSGLWVNLFIASELNWKQRAVKLRQETDWPFAESTQLIFTCENAQDFALRLRRPYWAKEGIRVRLNGKSIETTSTSTGYAEIRRAWQTGDRVEMDFPMSLRTEAMPDNKNRFAIFYGPTLLAANLGPVDDPGAEQRDFVPVLVNEGQPVADWVKPASLRSLTFRTSGVGKPHDVDLVPFFALHDRRYTVFFDQYTKVTWAQREAENRAEQEREAKLAARTLDILRIGEMQPERDHNLQGEHTTAGDALGRKWRHAIDGGWFAFDLKVAPDRPNDLSLTFWGSESGRRTFDILVNGTKVATETLLNNKPGQFFDVVYPLDAALTKGKEKVAVRLQAHPDNWAGGLFGARTLRRENP